MSINKKGIIGEKLSLHCLYQLGFELFQADWIGLKDGSYTF